MPLIYIVEHLDSDRKYIGKVEKEGATELDRFKGHIKSARHPETHFHRTLAKFGADRFRVSILEAVDDVSQIDERERYWIKELSPSLNMTKGGEGGSTTHSRKWYNDGVKNLYILDGEPIPEGFVRGRLCKFNDPEFQREQAAKVDVKKRAEAIKKAWGDGKMEHRSQVRLYGDDNPTKRPEVAAKISASKMGKKWSPERRAARVAKLKLLREQKDCHD